ARSPKVQLSDWLGLLPESEQSALAGLICQVTPAPEPAGSGSERVTPAAVPVPWLLTTIVKPMSLPALTEPASAVLVMCSSAGWQVIESCAVGLPSLVEWAVAVLS